MKNKEKEKNKGKGKENFFTDDPLEVKAYGSD